MASANTRLQYGRFKGLSLPSLRPTRGPDRHPVTGPTLDGKVRGLVQTMRGYRHIDVTAEHGMGARVHLHPWPRPVAGQLTEVWHNYALSELPCRVLDVRAVRLRALIAEPGGAPWIHAGAPVEEAVTDWDEMLDAIFQSVPTRHRAHHNPWLWCHTVELNL